MANISLTSACDLGCSFCFAGGGRSSVEPRHISSEDFDVALDFLHDSDIGEARLLGGEPTQHPRFPELVGRALDRGFRVKVFTNGLMSDEALNTLVNAPRERIRVLVNARPRAASTEQEWSHRARSLRALASLAMIGLTIDEPQVDAGFVLEWIETNGLERAVRLGLAHPSPDGRNRFLHPRSYAAAGEALRP